MKSRLADLVRLFVLVNLLVLALFTIPAHVPDHNIANTDKQQLKINIMTVTDASSMNQKQTDF